MAEKDEKKLGLWNVVGLGVGGTIGSGIFVILGLATAKTGRSILLVTTICVFYMLFAYWYNLAMSGIFVIKGGDYSMKGMVLPALLTGYGAWSNFIWAFACAGHTLAIVSYLEELWPQIQNFEVTAGVIVLTVFTLMTARGSRFVVLFQNYVTIVLIAALALFIIFGVPHVDAAHFFDPSYDGGFFRNGIAGVISAIALMGWACQGATMGPVSVVAVTKNPKKLIPQSILVTSAIVAVIYGLMSYVAAGVLPYDQIAGQNLGVTAKVIFPAGLFAFFILGGGFCAILSSLLNTLIMIRYPLIHSAEDGWFPSIFKKQTKEGFPYVSYLLVYIMALIPILTKMSVGDAISMLMIPTMLINTFLNVYCLVLPKKYPEQFAKRSIKCPTWLYNVCCVLGGVSALAVSITLFMDLTPANAALAVLLVVLPILFSWIALKKKMVDKNVLQQRRDEIIQDALNE